MLNYFSIRLKLDDIIKDIEFEKKVLENITEKASGAAGEASEHIADFAEDANEEFQETKTKTKSFFQRLFGK